MFKIIWITSFKTRKKPLVAMKDKEEEKKGAFGWDEKPAQARSVNK